MSILTGLPAVLNVNTPQVVTIDKNQFVTDFAIVDPFWSNPSYWNDIEFFYVDNAGISQTKKMTFAGNTFSLDLPANTYDGTWECQKITLHDGNNQSLIFTRDQFPIADEFDFDSIGGIGSAFEWTDLNGEVATNGGGELHRTGPDSDWDNFAWHQPSVGADFTLTMLWTKGAVSIPGSIEGAIGYSKTDISSRGSYPNFGTPSQAMSSGWNYGNGNGFNGAGGTATPVTPFVPVNNTQYTIEIKRVAGAITFKVDATTILTDTYVGPIWFINMPFGRFAAVGTDNTVTDSVTLTQP